MPNSPASTVIEHVRKVVLRENPASQTDGQLLHRFIDTRDELAFEALVRRHGTMVLGVCRRLLGHAHDAEDAFQATFLVLARKAASIVPREAVGNWLYGVAYHTALKAQAAALRRRAKEKQVTVMPEPPLVPEDGQQELLPLLDRELNRLPDKYRLPVVLCDLEGRSRREVASQLKIPEGTLSSRLTTARQMLARRLRQRGLALTGGAVAAAIATQATAAHLPCALVVSTVNAATQFTTGATAALSSGYAAALAEGVVKSMFLSKLKSATLIVATVIGLTALAGRPAYQALAVIGAEAGLADRHGADEAAAHAADGAHAKRIEGSGNAVTKEMNITDFTAVAVSSVFRVEITRGDTFRTAITADDNVFPFIKLDKEGSTLRLSLDSKNKSISVKTLKAAITMPALAGVTTSGASQVTFKGFKAGKDFKAKVTSASKLEGEIEAGKLDLDVASAGRVTLKGTAKTAHIQASGASTLNLGHLAVDQADVTLTSASRATLNVKTKLDYDLGGASRLVYQGDPALGKHKLSGASRASKGSSPSTK